MGYADEDSGPEGIGGWMGLFLFGFGFVGPLMLIFGSFSNLYGDPKIAITLGERWLAYQIAEWTIVALGVGTIAYVVWRLFNVRTSQTVRLTIFAIPFVVIGITLLDILATVIIGRIDAGLLFSVLGTDLVRGVVYSAIWCSYFNVSKRVRNTYPVRVDDETVLAFE